jgi:hypothetical protein
LTLLAGPRPKRRKLTRTFFFFFFFRSSSSPIYTHTHIVNFLRGVGGTLYSKQESEQQQPPSGAFSFVSGRSAAAAAVAI